MQTEKQRERLVELLKNADTDKNLGWYDLYDLCLEKGGCAEYFADYLMSNNVVVLPLKVGDRVYVPWNWCGTSGIAVVEVQEIRFYDKSGNWMFFIELQSDDDDFNLSFGGWKTENCIGKTVFLSRAEAENMLKERKENGK